LRFENILNQFRSWIVEHWSDTTQLQEAISPEKDSDATELVEQSDDASQSHRLASVGGIAMDEADQDGVSALPPHHPPQRAFEPLQGFPKEFNKNYLESLDRRYLAILILTLILEPLFIWYMLRTHPVELSEHDLAKLQSKYAELFLSEFKMENEPPAEMSKETDILSRAAETVPRILEGVAGEFPGGTAGSLNRPGRRGSVSPEARGLSGENRNAVRRLNTMTRQRGMQALSEEVERIGLLGVITSGGSGIVSQAPVTDILQYADSTVSDIEHVIAQVQQLRVPRAGIDYFGTSVGVSARSGFNHSDEVHIVQKDIRGKRATASGVVPEDIVTGLAVAPQRTIERIQKFEQVASAPVLLPTPGISGLRSRPANEKATRDREKIRETVLAHNPAIQDCYRRQLKGNAALKGKVTVRFTINHMGYVVHAEIVSADMTADGAPIVLPEMEECILTKIRKWRDFGQVDESQSDVTFRQTYNFGY
jgi:hypothetical protein